MYTIAVLIVSWLLHKLVKEFKNAVKVLIFRSTKKKKSHLEVYFVGLTNIATL